MFRSTVILSTFLAGMLALSSSAAEAQQPGSEESRQYVSLMSDYLSLADQVVDIARDRETAVFLALEGIFEVYEQRHDAPGAVRHYERLLEEHGSNATVRNLIRLKLRDIYKNTGQADKALEQLELIIAENAG